jgi:hypothetical protein
MRLSGKPRKAGLSFLSRQRHRADGVEEKVERRAAEIALDRQLEDRLFHRTNYS